MAHIPALRLSEPISLLSWTLDGDEHCKCLNRLRNVVMSSSVPKRTYCPSVLK
jgi:hypothetical protein